MSIFHRKNTWERALDSLLAASTAIPVRRTAKATLGVLGGAFTATALSAAVSTARRRGEK